MSNLLAQTNCMRILLKLADFLDTTKVGSENDEDDEEEFEDCEEMDDEEDGEPAQVIDLDSSR